MDNLTDELMHTFAQQEDLKPEYVDLFAGSTPPLHFAVVAFTSPQKSYVGADPGYEAGPRRPRPVGLVWSPLGSPRLRARRQGHARRRAGRRMFYICNPNNPTGTLTPHTDLEYLVENKPKGSIVMGDEA